ncbi:MAG: hypothetical protein EOO61_06335 [Hymenobacter sp.]|nr:MAG: hypothetical protein EOO61_06335 [Hymenobacter sp.]
MKSTTLLVAGLLSSTQLLHAQNSALTRIYVHQLKSTGNGYELRTTLNPDSPIEIGRRGSEGYVLVETDADSIGLKLKNNKTVYIHLERGQSYYYRLVTNYLQPVSYNPSPITVNEVTEQEFWLNIYLNTPSYRHYLLKKDSGLSLQEDIK